MSRFFCAVVGSACIALCAPATAQYQTGAEVAAQEMAKARAEKAKNDAIVEKQRAAEKAQKERATPSPSPSPKPEKASSDTSKGKKSP